MEGSETRRDVGRPSKMAQYAPQVAQWLGEDPDLSGAEILRRVRLAGYPGGKSALYELVRQLRAPDSGYPGCPLCRAILRNSADTSRHCGQGTTHGPVLGAETVGETCQETDVPATDVPASERYLVIAASDRQELYEYLKRKFGRAATIEVVREQRSDEWRTPELRAFGFAVLARD
jgi:hypothetical protein